MTEGRNTGFKKILNALEANGSPKPEFETDEDRSYFITRIFVHERFYEVSVEELQKETSLKQVLKQKDYEKLEPVIEKLASAEAISIQEVMQLTNKSRTTAWRYMQKLVECGIVETTGSTNNVTYKKCD